MHFGAEHMDQMDQRESKMTSTLAQPLGSRTMKTSRPKATDVLKVEALEVKLLGFIDGQLDSLMIFDGQRLVMLLQAPDSVPGNRSASRSASSVRDTPARRALDVRDRRQGSPRRDRSRVEAILGNMSYHSVTRPNSCHVRISLISGTSSKR